MKSFRHSTSSTVFSLHCNSVREKKNLITATTHTEILALSLVSTGIDIDRPCSHPLVRSSRARVLAPKSSESEVRVPSEDRLLSVSPSTRDESAGFQNASFPFFTCRTRPRLLRLFVFFFGDHSRESAYSSSSWW